MKLIDHVIAARSPGLSPARAGDVFDPATGAIAARVAFASPEVVDEAVEAAARAFESWRDSSLAQRARVLFAFRELVERRKDDLPRHHRGARQGRRRCAR